MYWGTNMKAVIPILLIGVFVKNTIESSINPTSQNKTSKGCEIKLNIDLNQDREPIFFSKKGSRLKLTIPELVDEKGVIKLSKDESLYVACPGSRNELRGFSSDENRPLESKCVKNQTLHLEGKNVTSLELECKSKVNAVLKEVNTTCGGRGGRLIQLGFDVESWHPLVTLCYGSDRAETLYSIHVLHGAVLQGAETKKHQSYFVKGSRSIYAGFNPERAYKQTNQREVLTQLLGSTRANQALTQSYLSRGHLSPDADFLLGTWQDLSYFYVNAAPQWQTINAGNWLKLENLVRRFASNAKQDLSVTTGTYGVLEMEDENEVPQKIFLVPSKQLMPVPSLFWKLVEDTKHNACIVFLVHNNPFLDGASIRGLPICKDICNDHGWLSDAGDISKGLSYCCSFSEFKKVVNYAPDIHCSSVLNNL